jgi:hypothetical protein
MPEDSTKFPRRDMPTDSPRTSRVRRRALLAAGAGAVGVSALGAVVVARGSNGVSQSSGRSIQPVVPGGVDSQGFSTHAVSLMRGSGAAPIDSYDDRSPMTNRDGFYLAENLHRTPSGRYILSAQIVPSDYDIPSDIRADYRRNAGSVMYCDDRREYGRWTFTIRRYQWKENACHAAIMLWPDDGVTDQSKVWPKGEFDGLEFQSDSLIGHTYIHDDDPTNTPESAPIEVPVGRRIKVTIEVTPVAGVRVLVNDKVTGTHGPDGIAKFPRRPTVQVDAEGSLISVNRGPAIAPRPLVEVLDITYAPHLGLEHAVSPSKPIATPSPSQEPHF